MFFSTDLAFKRGATYNPYGLLEHCAWQYGECPTELRLRDNLDRWTASVKMVRGPEPLIAYVDADTYPQALASLLYLLDKRACDWKPDKWPTRRYVYRK